MRRFSTSIRIITAICCIMLPAVMNAQTDTIKDLTSMNLEDLLDIKITTASKTSQEAGKAPATVMVITEEQIRTRGYRSLAEVLQDLPEFKVDNKSYSTNYNSITVRGVQGQDKFVILLDGVRIKPPANENHPVIENYPVHLAKQIEVIYGPASALYGADAMTGIINIITKKAEWTNVKAEANYAMGDYGLYNGSLFASKKLGKDIVLTLSSQYFYDKGPDMSKLYKEDTLWDMSSHSTGTFNSIYGPMTPTKPVKSEYEAPISAYNLYTALNAGQFIFSFFRSHSRNSTAMDNNPNNTVYNKDVFYGRSVNVFNATHSAEYDKIVVNSTLTASQYKLDRGSNYRNLYTNMERAYKYGFSSMIRAEEQVEWRAGEKTNIIGGAIFESFFASPESADLQDQVDESKGIEGVLLGTQSYYRPQGLEAKIYTVKYYNAGTYLQLQQEVLNKIMLTLGARYDHNSRFGTTFNPRLGIVYDVTKGTRVKALAGTSYLAPTPVEAYSYYGTFFTPDSGKTYQSYFFHLPNPELKPMRSENYELSLHQEIGKKLGLTITGYYTELNNLIHVASDSGNTNLYNGEFMGWNVDYIEVFINSGRQENTGATIMLDYSHKWKKGKLYAYSAASYVDGTIELPHDPVDAEDKHAQVGNMTPWVFKAGTDITHDNFTIAPRIIISGKQRLSAFKTGTNERQTLDGYTLLNIAASYRIGKFSVFANATNVLNQRYKSGNIYIDLEKKPTEFFYGNYQDPIRFNGGLRVSL